jgi:Ohr subfamily peroxiredoxin
MSIKPLYTAHAKATGGRDGRATIAEDGVNNGRTMTLATPGTGRQRRGQQSRTAVCRRLCRVLHRRMKFAAGQDKALPRVPADVVIDSAVSIGTRDEGGFGLAVTLTIHLPGVDPAAAEALVDRADATCPYSHATRGNIDVTLNVA